MRLSTRAQNVLFITAMTSIATSLALAAYLFYNMTYLAHKKAQLKNELALQQQLVTQTKTDGPYFPHINKEVSYTLNPFLKTATLNGFPGQHYDINDLGLRGAPVVAKRPGTKRIVVVGDSVVFGWKLKDQDRLEAVLTGRYQQAGYAIQYPVEFITIGLPGWNIRDEVGFLTHHLRRIDADVIVWFTIPNDLFDSPSVLPSGMLAEWTSQHATHNTPFNVRAAGNRISYHFTPLLEQRFAENLKRISTFEARFKTPVLIVTAEDFASVNDFTSVKSRLITVPLKLIKDKRWGVSESDKHPSRWANELLATAILDLLAKHGHAPKIPNNDTQTEHLILFEQAKEVVTNSKERRHQLARDVSKQIHHTFRDSETSASTILFGMHRENRMQQAGALLLNNDEHGDKLTLTIQNDASIVRYPRLLTVTIRPVFFDPERHSDPFSGTKRIDQITQDVAFSLPSALKSAQLLEVSWLFDGSECEPGYCDSAELLSARIVME